MTRRNRKACSSPRGGDEDPTPIQKLLEHFSYETAEAQSAARAMLEDAGLTNPRKTNIAGWKPEQVAAILTSRFALICDSNSCQDMGHGLERTIVVSRSSACEVCGGRGVVRAVKSMQAHLQEKGLRRLLVVGGSPASHAELRQLFDRSSIDLDVISADKCCDSKRAEALATHADVIVIWGTTELKHSVSSLFNGPSLKSKRVPLARRGIEALGDAVITHLRG